MTPELAKKELQDIVNRQEIGNSDIESDHGDADDRGCLPYRHILRPGKLL